MQNTPSVDCHGNEKPQRFLSSVALAEGETWRAYVEVDVQSDRECLHTTRLWVAKANHPYRLVYLVPPKRDLAENGMEILGWARNSRMRLAKPELWQYGSDAPDEQQVFALDAATGAFRDAGWSVEVPHPGLWTAKSLTIVPVESQVTMPPLSPLKVTPAK